MRTTSDFRTMTLKAPDGRLLRAGVWALPEHTPARAACVLLEGHTEFLEKYGEVASELNARGFVVASIDWRGQGASERARRVYGNRCGHVGHFEEYDLDLNVLLNQVVAPFGLPVVGLAHSMGAHVLLRYLHDHPSRFRCGVLVSPMLDIDFGAHDPRLAQAMLLLMNLRRPSPRFLPGMEERDQMTWPFEQNLVTSDRGRYERMQRLLREQPYLRINGPTWGWLGAATASMRRMRRSGYAERIRTPLLVFGAGHDRIVHVDAVRRFAKRLPDARYVEVPEAEHEILMETDAIRAQFWPAFDGFVDQQLAKQETGHRGFAGPRPATAS
jgi:lysophospholipase